MWIIDALTTNNTYIGGRSDLTVKKRDAKDIHFYCYFIYRFIVYKIYSIIHFLFLKNCFSLNNVSIGVYFMFYKI